MCDPLAVSYVTCGWLPHFLIVGLPEKQDRFPCGA